MRRTLYTAEGNLNLGKYDDAKKHYQEALKIDPYNSAARRGIEKVEAAKATTTAPPMITPAPNCCPRWIPHWNCRFPRRGVGGG